MNHTEQSLPPFQNNSPENTSAKKSLSIPFVATVFAFAAIIVVLLIARFIVLPRTITHDPLYLQQFSQDPRQETACRDFMNKLPDKLLEYHKNQESYVSTIPGSGVIHIRCGINPPAELTSSSHIHIDNTVKWFNLSSQADPSKQKSAGLIWVTTDRPIIIAIWIPADASTGPIQDLSSFIAHTLPAVK